MESALVVDAAAVPCGGGVAVDARIREVERLVVPDAAAVGGGVLPLTLVPLLGPPGLPSVTAPPRFTSPPPAPWTPRPAGSPMLITVLRLTLALVEVVVPPKLKIPPPSKVAVLAMTLVPLVPPRASMP